MYTAQSFLLSVPSALVNSSAGLASTPTSIALDHRRRRRRGCVDLILSSPPLRPARKALEQELAVIHNGTLTTVDLRGHIQRVVEETSAMPCTSLLANPIRRLTVRHVSHPPPSPSRFNCACHSDVQYDRRNRHAAGAG